MFGWLVCVLFQLIHFYEGWHVHYMLGCRMCLDWAKQVLHLLEKTIHRLTTIVFLAAEFYKCLKTVDPLTAQSISTNSFILYTMFCLFFWGGGSQMDLLLWYHLLLSEFPSWSFCCHIRILKRDTMTDGRVRLKLLAHWLPTYRSQVSEQILDNPSFWNITWPRLTKQT